MVLFGYRLIKPREVFKNYEYVRSLNAFNRKVADHSYMEILKDQIVSQLSIAVFNLCAAISSLTRLCQVERTILDP